MATFVLVAGAWHGGWCWKRVRPLLRKAGHEVFTPTLTGLGERVHLLSPEVDLETHVTDIVNVLKYEDLTDVVLVGHSYSGVVVGVVSHRVPERIAQVIYLDALVPENGKSIRDLHADHGLHESVQRARQRLETEPDGWKDAPPAPDAPVLGVTEQADIAWMRCSARKQLA
jgi:pimeloyl-ACP methyl ester carboxylesterase